MKYLPYFSILGSALAHGGLQYPACRQKMCEQDSQIYNDNLSLCESVRKAGGEEVIFYWSGVSQLPGSCINVNYDEKDPSRGHYQVMGGRDATICSAVRSEFDTLRQTKVDWLAHATPIKSGPITFQYLTTAKHRIAPTCPKGCKGGYVDFYITKSDRSSKRDMDLTWKNLDRTPFCTFRPTTFDTPLQSYAIPEVVQDIPCIIPEDKKGLHTIYTVWQREDSPEAFYGCSDVYIE